MHRKRDKYLLDRPNGEWELWSLPRAFNVKDVQAHAPHSVIWLFVPRGCNIYCRFNAACAGFRDGPAWVRWNPDVSEYDRISNVRPDELGPFTFIKELEHQAV